MSVSTYTKTGSKSSTVAKLEKSIFEVDIRNHELLKQAYDAYLANGRQNLAKTKTRGMVRGGGKKPYRQKGTGRARFGSTRNPIWRGGGIAFGPDGDENYSKKISQTAKRLALKQSLTLTSKENRLKVIETFECKDGRVKPTVNLLKKIEARGLVMLVVSVKDELVERATRNLADVTAVQAKYLNAHDVINANTVVIEQKALEIINGWLGGSK